jgi:hypothetical protein
MPGISLAGDIVGGSPAISLAGDITGRLSVISYSPAITSGLVISERPMHNITDQSSDITTDVNHYDFAALRAAIWPG